MAVVLEVGCVYCVAVVLKIGWVNCMAVLDMCFLNPCFMFCVGVLVSVLATIWRGEVWVFCGLKSCFEVKNFSIFPFFAIFAFILFC